MKAKSKPFQIVSIGDLVVDVILSVPQLPVKADEHQILKGLQLEPGGAGNFLVAGARLGMKMTALGALGEDIFSDALCEMLIEENVEVGDLARQPTGSSTTVFVLEDDLHEHVFLGQYGEGEIVSFSENWKAHIDNADAVQFWGYSLHETRLVGCVFEAAEYARTAGKVIVFDPGPLLASASPEDCKKILSCATVVLCTENELAVLGAHCKTTASPSALLALGPSLVCVKYGQSGCKIFTESETIEHPGFVVPVVDTNAAGDSFMAAFVFGLLSGWPMQTVAAFANAMGATKVQKYGSGRQVPTASELREVLRKFAVEVDF